MNERTNSMRFGASLVLSLLLPGAATAQVQIQSGDTAVFGGGTRMIGLQARNQQTGDFEANIRFQVYQAASATVMPIGKPSEWKKLRVLAGQTVLETAPVKFPAVTAKSRIIVEWLNDENKVLGRTDAMVYPTNVLAGLKPLLQGGELGIWDPAGALKPSLQRNDIEFADLEEAGLADFHGRLAILGPFPSAAQTPEHLARSIEKLIKKGMAVIWIQSPPPAGSRSKPSCYLVAAGKGAAVVVQPELMANFSDNPGAQEHFVEWCAWALNPESPALPNPTRQP